MSTNKRLLATKQHKTCAKQAKIYRLPDTREYMVRFGDRPEADYFTDCQNDAYRTADHWCAGEV